MSSTFCSSRQPSRSSSWCCSSPSRSSPPASCVSATRDRRVVIVGDERAELAEARRDFVEDRAIAGRGNVLIEPRDAQPRLAPDRAASGGWSADSTRSRLVLPAPLRPISAMRSPGSIWRSASSNSGRWPKARPICCNDSRGTSATSYGRLTLVSHATGEEKGRRTTRAGPVSLRLAAVVPPAGAQSAAPPTRNWIGEFLPFSPSLVAFTTSGCRPTEASRRLQQPPRQHRPDRVREPPAIVARDFAAPEVAGHDLAVSRARRRRRAAACAPRGSAPGFRRTAARC